jgi:hypothetical protein
METSEMISAYKDIVAETIQSGSNGEYNVVAAKFLNDMGKVLETMLSLEGAVGSKKPTMNTDILLGLFKEDEHES